jgi:SM-20-related protein
MIGTTEQSSGDAGPPVARSMLPPYLVIANFLAEQVVAELLDLAVAQEGAFCPSPVFGKRVDPSVRKSASVSDLKDFGSLLRAKVREILPRLTVELGMRPVAAPQIESHFVAHRDGDFLERHIDTLPHDRRAMIGEPDDRRLRLLSAIYYFHAQPKAFSGGVLRLHSIGDPRAARFVDIEPAHNSLVVFPAWAPHEVRPVRCASGRFIDSRFAANIFVSQERPAPSFEAEFRR